MAVNIDPIFPASPTVDIADLSAATPLTSRATITGTTGLTALTTTTTNGKRIDSITVKMSNTVAGAATNVFIWINNGTNSYLFDEFDMSAVTPGNTTDSAVLSKSYTTLVLPPTYRLYVSTTVSSSGNANCSVFAFGGNY